MDEDSFRNQIQDELNIGGYEYQPPPDPYAHFFDTKKKNCLSSYSEEYDDDDGEEEEDSDSDSNVERDSSSSTDSMEEEEEEEEKRKLEAQKKFHGWKNPNPNGIPKESPPHSSSSSSEEADLPMPTIAVKKGPSPITITRQLKSSVTLYLEERKRLEKKESEMEERKKMYLSDFQNHLSQCQSFQPPSSSSSSLTLPFGIITPQEERVIEKSGLGERILIGMTSSLDRGQLNTLLFSQDISREWGESKNFYCVSLNNSELVVIVRK